MNKVFLVGSSGYIGSNLSAFLKKSLNNYRVLTVGRHDEDDISFDLMQPSYDFSEQAFKDDVVIFLAAISSPDICAKNYQDSYTINVTNTILTIDKLLKRGCKIIFSSSDVVYGASLEACDESQPKNPLGVYAEMKNEVEEYFKDEQNFKVIRFSYVFGKGDKFLSMLEISSNKKANVEIFGGFKRNVVSLDDVLLGISNLADNWYEFDKVNAINFCGEHLVSREEITNCYKKIIDENLLFSVVDAPDGFWSSRSQVIEMKSLYFKHLLGRKPKTLSEMIVGLKND